MALGYDPKTIFMEMMNSGDALINKMSGSLVGEGLGIASALLLVTIGWSILTWLLSGDGIEALVDSVGSLARYFLVAMVLGAWSSGVGFAESQAGAIKNALGAKDTTQEVVSTIMTAVDMTLLDRKSVKCEVAPCSSTGWWAKVTDVVVAVANLGETVASIPVVIVNYLMRIIAVGLLLLMAGAYLAVLLLAKVQFAIALIFGPILVPWLVWKRSEWLFDGWLKFALIAVMSNLVATVMATLVVAMLAAIQTLAKVINNSSNGPLGSAGLDYLAAGAIMIIAGIGAYMMWQAPSLASGLIGSGSGGDMRGASRATGKAASMVSGGAMKIVTGGK